MNLLTFCAVVIMEKLEDDENIKLMQENLRLSESEENSIDEKTEF